MSLESKLSAEDRQGGRVSRSSVHLDKPQLVVLLEESDPESSEDVVIHMPAHAHIDIKDSVYMYNIYIYTYIYINIYIYIHACMMYACMPACMHACMHVGWTDGWMDGWMFVCKGHRSCSLDTMCSNRPPGSLGR